LKLRDARRDYYRRLAREQGYKSRAAFKLLETSKRYHLIGAGDVVADLGAAPGGWVQVASELVGESGMVVGLDLLPIELEERNVRIVTGDVFDDGAIARVRTLLPRRLDVGLSDLSPSITGAWDLDHFRQIELVLRALTIFGELLTEGGNVMVKVFDGERLPEVRKTMRDMFRSVSIVKPAASRRKSSELYMVGLGYHR
jgi:23S rRNA (uridine2552-2'-O)-methyltransferase